MTTEIKMIIQPIEESFNWVEGQGKLWIARPTRSKPKATTAEDWCEGILRFLGKNWKGRLAIPRSFWLESNAHLPQLDWESLPGHIVLEDTFSRIGEWGFSTPGWAPAQIFEAMRDGEDVLLLSATKKVSGFLPALLTQMMDPLCHVEKVLWPLGHAGYTFSLAQCAYLAGLTESRFLECSPSREDAGGKATWDKQLEQFDSPLPQERPSEETRALAEAIREIGKELLYVVAGELLDLANFLGECGEHPVVNDTSGAFASVGYRAAQVLKDVGNTGHDLLTGLEQPGWRNYSAPEMRGMLTKAVNALQQIHGAWLVFLPLDLDVLAGHPEVAQVTGLADAVKLCSSQLFDVDARVESLIEEANLLIQASDAGTPVPPPTKHDEGSRVFLKSLLANCLANIREKSAPETPAPSMHPKVGECGKVLIKQPTKPGSLTSWKDASKLAVFTPGGKAPVRLNGILMAPWSDHPRSEAEWNRLDDLLAPDIKEPPMPKSHLPLASGAVVVERDGRIWMVAPTNQFGGYPSTFPKGKLDSHEVSLQANAIKECFEESGLKVRITGYLGDFKRTTSITRLYLAERVGGAPTDMGWESQAVMLVPPDMWAECLQNPSDQPVLAALTKLRDSGGLN